MTQVLPAAQASQAGAMIASGDLVAFPTETVYGLGANACNGASVARIFEAKGRPSFNPLIVHMASLAEAELIGEFDDAARALASAFWPGALTIVVPLKYRSGISDLVTAGLSTVALRVPDHPLALDVLNAARCPIAAPSANPSGAISPTTAEHVTDGLAGKIDAVLDGGPCDLGIESTIVGGKPTSLLRPGGIPREALEACLGASLEVHEGGTINAPGQMTSHYAPNSSLRLNAVRPAENEVLIGFGSVAGDMNLSQNGDLREAAANLFAMLRRADAIPGELLAVAPIPEIGLGVAINDRLRRAAAPKD